MASMTPEQIVELLETQMRRSGLSNRELRAMKDAKQAAWDANPNSIAGVMRQRQALSEEQAKDLQEHNDFGRRLREANAIQEQLGGGLIGQDVINRNSQRNRNNVKSGLIGDYTPEKYTYRDFKPGETYDSDTDLRVQVDGGEPGFRRREVNPEWQRWMVNQAQEIKGKESGGGEKARPAPVSVIDKMAELLESRRNAQTPQDRAKFDEQIAMLRSQYPSLGGGISPNANTSIQGGVQQAVEQGVPANVANQLFGAAALQQSGTAPTPPGEAWSAPRDPIVVEVGPKGGGDPAAGFIQLMNRWGG